MKQGGETEKNCKFFSPELILEKNHLIDDPNTKYFDSKQYSKILCED